MKSRVRRQRPPYQPFNELINEASGGNFVTPPIPVYQAEVKRRRRESFQLFFDQEALIRRLGEIFEGENKRAFTGEELTDVYIKAHIRHEKTEYWRGGLFILRDVAGELGGSVSLEAAASLVERNWADWSIGNIYEYLAHDADGELTLTDEQKAVDDVNRLNMEVLDALRRIGVQSAGTYESVRNAVESFLHLNIESDEGVRYLYRYLDGLERQYYVTRSENVSLAEVLDKLGEVGLLPP